MIVVSNTSPITNLAAIGRLALLENLFGQIYIPTEVTDELNADGQAWPGYKEVIQSPWFVQSQVKNLPLVNALMRDLDRGEAAAIALGIDLSAGLVLMDEREGRHQAQRLGLKVLGVVGILADAKTKALIPQIRPELDALRNQAGFYLTESLYQAALIRAGER